MKFSVIIPTCDREEYLVQAIQSVLSQTCKPLEIVIINNGKNAISEDKFVLLDPKLKVYNIIPYAGASQARNFGASIAKGGYLAFIDDDDLWPPDYLEKINSKENEGYDCFISRLDKLEDDQILPYKNADGNLSKGKILNFNPGVTGSNIVISKKAFFLVGGYDSKLPVSEDRGLLLEIIKNKIKIATMPNNQAIIRIHRGVRLSNPSKQAEGIYQFLRKYRSQMNKKTVVFNLRRLYYSEYRAGKKFSYLKYYLAIIVGKFL